MNNTRTICIIMLTLLNIAAYLIGRHDGKKKGYDTMLMIFKAVSPNETDAIVEKNKSIDPVRFAREYAARKNEANHKGCE